jgi:hypothetical protein
MRFFSRRRTSVDARRRNVRPALEVLESRLVPSSVDKVLRIYPLDNLVLPVAQGPATSGFQGLGGGYLNAASLAGPNAPGVLLALGPPVSSLAQSEQSWWTTFQNDLGSLFGSIGNAITSAEKSISSLFTYPQLPPPQLLKVPGTGTGFNGGGFGGGGFGGLGNPYSALNQEALLITLINEVLATPNNGTQPQLNVSTGGYFQ